MAVLACSEVVQGTEGGTTDEDVDKDAAVSLSRALGWKDQFSVCV